MMLTKPGETARVAEGQEFRRADRERIFNYHAIAPREKIRDLRAMHRTPRTRVEEIRLKRGLRKSELARLAGMPPQTLQRIEDGSTKTLSSAASRLLAPALQVREDELRLPVGYPIGRTAKEADDIAERLLLMCREMLEELRAVKAVLERMAGDCLRRQDLGAVMRAGAIPSDVPGGQMDGPPHEGRSDG